MSVPQAKTGSGILMNFTFHMKTTGYSDLHITNPIMMYQDGSTQIEQNIVDYYTAVVDSGEYVVKIVGNAQSEMAYLVGSYSAHNVSKISEVINSILYEGQLKFSVTGYAVSEYSFAYFNVTIPKSMMWCDISSEWVVMLDDVLQGSRIVGGNTTHTTIYSEFTYGAHDTTQVVKILSTSIVPEFSSVFFAILLMLATFAAAIFGKMTWSVKRKS
jgi:hypothetical protein